VLKTSSPIEAIAARTRAAVKVTVGYSGGTVQLVKENGIWIAREITNVWIT